LSQLALKPELAMAIEEVEAAFPGQVSVEPDESGAIVHIANVELGPGWSSTVGVLSLLLPYSYPDAAIYPYHVTGAVPAGVSDGALQQVSWRGTQATQVSLRHNRWNPALDTALGSVLLVLARLRGR
jgi:hypothetical protein